jgi:hypothetical protein
MALGKERLVCHYSRMLLSGMVGDVSDCLTGAIGS